MEQPPDSDTELEDEVYSHRSTTDREEPKKKKKKRKEEGSSELPIDLTQDDDGPDHSLPATQFTGENTGNAKKKKKPNGRSTRRRMPSFEVSPTPPPPTEYVTESLTFQSQVGTTSQGYQYSSSFLVPPTSHRGMSDANVNLDIQDDIIPIDDQEEEDELLIMEMDDDNDDDDQEDELPLTPISTHTLDVNSSSSNQNTELPKRVTTPIDDDALEFERLMQRYEGKRRYEILAEGGEKESSSLGTSQTSTASSKSQREVEDLIDDEDEARNKVIGFLGSIITSFIAQLHTSQLLIQSRRAERLNPKKKKKKQVEDESQEEEPELLIQEEYTDDEVEVEGSQEVLQTVPGIKMCLKNRKTGNDQIISFPDDPLSNASGQISLNKIECVLRVVSVLYDAVCSRTTVTLRDIFYRDKTLFVRQDVVDKLVDDLVATAGMKRRDFYVCASAKGLIAATSLKIATLIDPIERISRLESSVQVDWVLVVEKDAVFQTLCSAKLLEDDRLGAGVMITGKGFPDLATRQMLHLIARTYPNAKIFALVDADPHGISILSTYTFGSRNTKFSEDHMGLSLGDRIEWLGLRATDFKKLGIGYDDLLPLAKVDISLAMKMIKDPTLPDEWKRELSQILHLNRKAEIEIILESNNGDSDQHDLLDDLLLFEDDHSIGVEGTKRRRKSKLVEYVAERIVHSSG
uniref:DNA topoisomerase (ATP-hydrolyzing) n=1 Tax=Kwoniella bestiolae CBS 10118 TaxID=1296100 RepID=A0A1B9G1U9_9TREE|nr:hypothetical protein I302_04778 [Kwoniella bestiolae CBS 10118]OCF24968.1 hypothetical protein I302_04778 [Kwoniella bestiolae CBS 10118]